MTLQAVTHINFKGDARAALEFYRSVFDGDLTILTYQDMHNVQHPDEANLVMWGQVVSDNGFAVMAYDVPASRGWDKGVDPFYESLRGQTVEEVTAIWSKLSDGATIAQPLGPAQWAPAYGMLTDKFGITWVVDVAVDYSGS
ncbi:PhnB protein [Nakamurella sp. UYEF19]|uniref:VOC family protein n=1 Tax=Nakamurella sp. UYEF19 TaxID=1756392 RepID=UPI0033960F04